MIKLKTALNWKGILYEAGATVSLTPELEVKMINVRTAERYSPGVQEQQLPDETKPDDKPKPNQEQEEEQEPGPDESKLEEKAPPKKKGGK